MTSDGKNRGFLHGKSNLSTKRQPTRLPNKFTQTIDALQATDSYKGAFRNECKLALLHFLV